MNTGRHFKMKMSTPAFRIPALLLAALHLSLGQFATTTGAASPIGDALNLKKAVG